jgi:phosphoglucosamine mutase
LFGTDGIRAPFGGFPLDRPTVTALGLHLGRMLAEGSDETPVVILGGDTRESTPELCAWLARGLEAGGARARFVGMAPTGGIAYLTRHLDAAAGVVVSASHNPYPDNGIKLLDGEGFKWSPEAEARLESRFLQRSAEVSGTSELEPERDLVNLYLDSLAAPLLAHGTTPPLAGLRVVLDTGNGAASPYAGPVFERLGARVTVIHDAPDGTNVNQGCGSTDTADLGRRVSEESAHLGIAFDGDADRAILVDASGTERDGDTILYLWATSLAAAGRLEPRKIVATSMSNLGLERALDRAGIEVVRCGVGDREVVAAMKAEGIALGGEQSGHVVHLGLTSTGDGLVTALQMAAVVQGALGEDGDGDRPLEHLLRDFQRYPQVLLNVPVTSKPAFDEMPSVAEAARSVEERLGDDGRLVLRYSGTEPLARIMIEGPEQETIEALAEEIAVAIRGEIGA